MSIVDEKMTALADEVRELSGTTGKLGIDDMTNAINTENTNFNTNLETQNDLIEQIQAALQGKASGGDSVSYDTCTVEITGTVPIGSIAYTTVENDSINAKNTSAQSGVTTSIICLCGSALSMYATGILSYYSGVEVLSSYSGYHIFKVAATSGSIVRITFVSSGGIN